MTDYPDGTLPISIIAYAIATLPVDIKAQTLGTVAIDIKAQTLGTVDINIKSQTAAINVDITAQTATLTVNIGTGAVSVRDFQTVIDGDFEQGGLGWLLEHGAEITEAYVKFGLKALLMDYTDENSYATSPLISPGIPTDNIESITVWQLVEELTDKLGVSIDYSDGTWTDNTLTNTAPGYEQHTLEFDAGKFVNFFEVWWDTRGGEGNAAIDALTINLKAERRTNITTSIQIDMNIAAQAVDIDIKTSGGVNLVIDKLTQTAYVEDRRTLSNNGETPTWTATTGNSRTGKFFPRGCRGFINTINVYCKDAAAAGGTITVYLSPHPSMGYIASADVTVPAEGAAAWRSATFNRMWNYDSMFIFIVCSNSNTQFARDTVEDPDQFFSTDSGATWTAESYRSWFRAVMKAMTVGDLPVSGTINTIELLSETSARKAASLAVPATSELFDTTRIGPGEVLFIAWRVSTAEAWSQLYPRLKIDGTEVFPLPNQMTNIEYLWLEPGFGVGLMVTKEDTTNNVYCICMNIKLPFRRTLQVGFYNGDAAQRTGVVSYIYTKKV